jgi:hypothetical protein
MIQRKVCLISPVVLLFHLRHLVLTIYYLIGTRSHTNQETAPVDEISDAAKDQTVDTLADATANESPIILPVAKPRATRSKAKTSQSEGQASKVTNAPKPRMRRNTNKKT